MIVVVLGGARSGKSQVAEERATRFAAQGAGRAVTFLATAVIDEADAAFAARIEEHRSRRPASWETVEVPLGGDLGCALEHCPPSSVALVDSLGTWLAGFPGFSVDIPRLTAALSRRRSGTAATILVSDEVGLGVHPETRAGLEFRDSLGALNRVVAAAADEVLLVVAGRVLSLPAADESVAQP